MQVYSYDGEHEVNLSNDDTHDYWWIKVNPSETKFLCYRSPKGEGLNSFSSCELMVFDIDGSNGTVIVPLNQYDWEIQAHAKWSPDGTKILASAKCKDPSINDLVSRGRLVVFNADGTNTHIVSKFLHDATDPACSHDREWIAYSKGAFANLFWTENHGIYKCRPDGSEDRLVLHDGKVNGVPTWTPNGERLVFHVLGLNTPPPFSLFSCDANGENKRMILSNIGVERSTVSAIMK